VEITACAGLFIKWNSQVRQCGSVEGELKLGKEHREVEQQNKSKYKYEKINK